MSTAIRILYRAPSRVRALVESLLGTSATLINLPPVPSLCLPFVDEATTLLEAARVLRRVHHVHVMKTGRFDRSLGDAIALQVSIALGIVDAARRLAQ